MVFEEDQLVFTVFYFFYLDGIEALADYLTLNQDVFDLCLAQLVNCSKIGQDEYQELLFFFC